MPIRTDYVGAGEVLAGKGGKLPVHRCAQFCADNNGLIYRLEPLDEPHP